MERIIKVSIPKGTTPYKYFEFFGWKYVGVVEKGVYRVAPIEGKMQIHVGERVK